MKTVVFSFDDGRGDNFEYAIPILEKYRFKCTLNIVSDYVENPDKYKGGSFKDIPPMTIKQILECSKKGHEIALHGHTHKNNAEDILKNIKEIEKWGIDISHIGFASPYSFFKDDNCPDITNLLNTGLISYIRTGIQTKRESFLYKIALWIEIKTHSKYLFWILNKKNIMKNAEARIFNSVTIRGKTKAEQIIALLEKMPDESAIIFMLHSVGLTEGDTWCWKANEFEKVCDFISMHDSYQVKRTKELLSADMR